MRHLLTILLFRLLGNSHRRTYKIPYLFGATTASHEARMKKWEHALARLYRDKDLLDFLYYQSESDKENIVRGKIRPDLARGARIRTLFIVYSAHRAFLSMRGAKLDVGQAKSDVQEDMKSLRKVYQDLTDTGDYS